MSELTSAERKIVRGKAQRLQPAVHLGKAGLSPTVKAELDRALTRDEIIKVRFHEADREVRSRLLTEIIEQTGATHCGSVGLTASFFRKKPEESGSED